MSGEALKAFIYLHDNVPEWIDTLHIIRARLADKQDELSKVPVAVTRIKKNRSGSMESLRPDDNAACMPAVPVDVTLVSPAPQASAHPNTGPSLITKRKRTSASLLSGHHSGIPKYRSRTRVVVYYDSEIQKSFETLVRNIGTGRNLLRKGKMEAKMEAMSSTIASDDDDSAGSMDGDDLVSRKLGYRPMMNMSNTRSTRNQGALGLLRDANAAGDAFDAADKALEQTQILCEKGAHQFLRDGDCEEELSACAGHLNEIIGISETQRAKWTAKEEERKAQLLRLELARAAPAVDPIEAKRISFHRTSTIELEVDSDEEEMDTMTLESFRPPIRMTRRY